MKVAIVGSRNLNIDISKYIPKETTQIITGGAKGIDTQAELYALCNHIPVVKIVPDYEKYGKSAPIIRNQEIVKRADKIIAIWDGESRGTKYSIDYARKLKKIVRVFLEPKY